MGVENLSIKEIIRNVKSELIEAEKEMIANNEAPLFKLKKLSVELNFIVTKQVGGKGKFDLKIVSASAGKNYSEGKVQKITLEWESIVDDLTGGYEKIGKGVFAIESGKYKITE